MHILKRNAHILNVLKNLNFLRLSNKVALENCILNCKCFNQSLHKTFKIFFTLATASHTHNTTWSNWSCCKIPSHNMKLYGRH